MPDYSCVNLVWESSERAIIPIRETFTTVKSSRKFTARRIQSSDNTQVRQNTLHLWDAGAWRKENKTDKGKEIIKYTQTYFPI